MLYDPYTEYLAPEQCERAGKSVSDNDGDGASDYCTASEGASMDDIKSYDDGA